MTTKASIDRKHPSFSFFSADHGTEFCKVIVGKTPKQRTFAVHKDLLANASEYFDRELNGSFSEAAGERVLRLERHCPIAFEALYQWVYTGRKYKIEDVRDMKGFGQLGDFYGTASFDDLYYLRHFELADESMTSELKRFAYERLTLDGYTAYSGWPGTELMNELFDTDCPQPLLQEYFAAHAAYRILERHVFKDSSRWQELFDAHPEYSRMVLVSQLQMANSQLYPKLVHPSKDPRFASDSLSTTTGEASKSMK
jgi:BTB/POZ domain